MNLKVVGGVGANSLEVGGRGGGLNTVKTTIILNSWVGGAPPAPVVAPPLDEVHH